MPLNTMLVDAVTPCIYFASDFHLGVDARFSSRAREQQLVRWLQQVVAPTATALYLVGDVFDFWFEYRHAVPKGYTRLLGTLAGLRDSGLPIYYFTGNHDMWVFKYFEEELGIPTYRQPIEVKLGAHRFFIGHGDGLGPADYGYKFIKKVFANPVCQWAFARLHPNLGIGLANFWSRRSRAGNTGEDIFFGAEHEWLLQYAERKSQTVPADFFVFGHRHLPIHWLLSNGRSYYVNLGEWLTYNSYAVYNGTTLEHHFFEVAPATVARNT